MGYSTSAATRAITDFVDRMDQSYGVYRLYQNNYLPLGQGRSMELSTQIAGDYVSIWGPIDVDWMINFSYANTSGPLGLIGGVFMNQVVAPLAANYVTGSGNLAAHMRSTALGGSFAERNALRGSLELQTGMMTVRTLMQPSL